MKFTMSIDAARSCYGRGCEAGVSPPLDGWEREVYAEVMRPIWQHVLAGLEPRSDGRFDGLAVLARLEDAIRATVAAVRSETQEAFLDVVCSPFEQGFRGLAEPDCDCPACRAALEAIGPTNGVPRHERLRTQLLRELEFHLDCVLKASHASDRRLGAPRVAWRRGKTRYWGGRDGQGA